MNTVIKNMMLIVLVMSIGGGVVGARQAPAPAAAPAATTNAPGPKIQFATTLYDFGRMQAGEPVKYTYVFTNTGCDALVINSVQPQCGCTTAGEWTKTVEPGKSGTIPIQFNTSGYNGPVFKQVTVNCNVTNQPLYFLQLKGTVYRPFEVIPQMVSLNLPPDAGVTSTLVTITNHLEQPLYLSPPEINNRLFSAELITNELGKGYQVKVSVEPPTNVGSVSASMILKTTWTNIPVIPVTLVATLQPAVVVRPAFITLAPGPIPSAVTNSVAIQNNSTNTLAVSDPVVSVPGVDAQIKETQPGRAFTALLAFPQGFQVPPGQQVEFSFKTSNPKFPVMKVPVMQIARPAPAMLPAPPAPAAAPPPPSIPLGPAAVPGALPKRVSSGDQRPTPPPPPLPPGM